MALLPKKKKTTTNKKKTTKNKSKKTSCKISSQETLQPGARGHIIGPK